jgi:hypothetical protein
VIPAAAGAAAPARPSAPATALVIAPDHDKDTSISSFAGKIAVTLKSVDEPVPTHDQRLPVAGGRAT